jgi:arylsulfatase A-like enzyme|tara:strand:- start:876 stop:2201 length:1326 start_codon:yes stop_codon:yes gene_type:complete
MNSNVLFLVIDALRADKFYGKSKTSITPNIDSLIKKGTYFSQAVSISDVTGKSVGSMVTGMYPFKTGMGNRKFNPNIETIFDILKKNEYNIYATVPNLTWFNQLTKKFDGVDNYFSTLSTHDGLSENVGKQIMKRLTSKQMKEPWIYYIHLEDMHDKIIVPPEFNKKEFGDTEYERMLSYVDEWIGKIVNHIDLEKTLVVITADHGDYIPIVKDVGIPRIQSFMKKGKHFFPKLEPIGIKLFIIMQNINEFFRQRKLKKELTPEQFRTLNTRGGKKVLYDETLRVPLLIVGNGMPSKKLDNLVSSLDISPTILNHIGLKMNNSSIDGRNLEILINENNIQEDPIFIESGDTSKHEGGFVIGVRTSKFKYFRTAKNPEKNRNLYDLQKDPLEKNNLVDSKQDIVISMEEILKEFQKQTANLELEEDENTKKIEDELRKLGYI